MKRFYGRDGIRFQASSRKESVVVQDKDGSKKKVQSRFLTTSVLQIYDIFFKE